MEDAPAQSGFGGSDFAWERLSHETRLSLPAGGGAIRGIEEDFRANPVTGSATYRIPVPVAPARGFVPAVGLGYDSGAGNGPFGVGWSLALPSIRRRTAQRLPTYDDAAEADVFLFGASRLVPVTTASGEHHSYQLDLGGRRWSVKRYRERVNPGFGKIERWTDPDSGESWWKVVDAANVTSVFGYHADARLADPVRPTRVFEWKLQCSFDDRGHYYQVDYQVEDLAGVDRSAPWESHRDESTVARLPYVRRLLYGNRESWLVQGMNPAALIETRLPPEAFHFQTRFDYCLPDPDASIADDPGPWDCRQDPFSNHRAGFEVRTWRLCHRIVLLHQFEHELPSALEPVSALNLHYGPDPVSGLRLLDAADLCHFQRDPVAARWQRADSPTMRFEYQEHRWNSAVQAVAPETFDDLPAGVDQLTLSWLDYEGEGIKGILAGHDGGAFFKRNLGDGVFAGARRLEAMPSLADRPGAALRMASLEANGRSEWVFRQQGGYHPVAPGGATQAFQAFQWMPRGVDESAVRHIDLTGDGRPDLLISEHEVLCWNESLGQAGYAAARRVPAPWSDGEDALTLYSSAVESVLLADMTGDGLQDIVRVRHASVDYWPNQGYGRFGSRVRMANVPRFDAPDRFDPARLRIADIDGTGPTDLVYLREDRVIVAINQGGNAWSDPVDLPLVLPDVTPLSSVAVIDLLGRGTACLVWTTRLPGHGNRQLQYVDLMQGRKPLLLTACHNGSGKSVHLEYRSSVEFYLEDRRAGAPWISRLHFPVHCLSRVETREAVNGFVFQAAYRYRHGFYDAEEREFRGFGRVDRVDTESFDSLAGQGASNAAAAAFHQPPVLTRQWFHLGTVACHEALADGFGGEYYRHPSLDPYELPAPTPPSGLAARDCLEAIAALRGTALRTEVYGLDGGDLEGLPYSITAAMPTVRLLQPATETTPAVFQLAEREQIEFALDRDPVDPRIAHRLVLASDDYGRPTLSASVGYPRLVEEDDLPDTVREAQTGLAIVVSENEFTDDAHGTLGGHRFEDGVDAIHRLPQSLAGRAFELRPGAGLFDGSRRLRPERLLESWLDSADNVVGYADLEAAPGSRRLLSAEETRYIDRELEAALPRGDHGDLGLAHESFQLAFDATLIDAIYAGRVDAAAPPGGYLDLFGDGRLWAPGGRAVYDAGSAGRFFLPVGFEDAFGNAAFIDFDAYALLPVRRVDAAGNEAVAVNDYRVLRPSHLRDANHNWTAVAFDARGTVVRAAAMGKVAGYTGSLPPPDDAVCEGDNLAHPGSVFEYDPLAWQRDGTPAWSRTVQYTEHYFDNPDREQCIESYRYVDGFGQTVMTKAKFTPGEALAADSGGGAIVEDTGAAPRWVGNGRTIYNNKGNPVRRFEPYFSTTPDFESNPALVEHGVSWLTFYDPVDRAVCNLYPNRTHDKVVVSPWRSLSFDVNDCVARRDADDSLVTDPAGDPDVGHFFAALDAALYRPGWYEIHTGSSASAARSRAAALALGHIGTPAVTHFDSLGRAVCSVADNGGDGSYATVTRYDIEGNVIEVVDARGNRVMSHRYGMLPPGGDDPKPALATDAMDSGARWTWHDVNGRVAHAWDARGHHSELVYDRLDRNTHIWLDIDGTRRLTGYQEFVDADHTDAVLWRALNMIGHAAENRDTAGLSNVLSRDFKGNPTRSARRLLQAVDMLPDWNVDDRDELLEYEVFESRVEYDALNRVTRSTAPSVGGMAASYYRPVYNPGGGLERMLVSVKGATETPFVEALDYDARGQRQFIRYGNGVETRYQYEPDSLRLSRLVTTRGSTVLQDIAYTYDAVGNITEIGDNAQADVFFDNAVVSADQRFQYDALYRLLHASGREHAVQAATPLPAAGWNPMPHRNDGQALRTYTQDYRYDAVGNIVEMRHRRGDPGATGWTRHYDYADDGNRLDATTLGDPEQPFEHGYSYNDHGSMTAMPHLASMRWNAYEQLSGVDLGGGGTAWYVYDGAGTRVRKVVQANALVKERIYLGGWEIYRERNGSGLRLERETLHVMDDRDRIAMVESTLVDTAGDDPDSPLVRYQLGNHLGSAALELDRSGQVISYEEYHPYGSTAYFAATETLEASPKRYRYTGKERDEETGLSYHGARYLATWLARWTAADPAGLNAGANFYRVVRNRPTALIDPDGLQETIPVIETGPDLEPDRTEWILPVRIVYKDDKLMAGDDFKPAIARPLDESGKPVDLDLDNFLEWRELHERMMAEKSFRDRKDFEFHDPEIDQANPRDPSFYFRPYTGKISCDTATRGSIFAMGYSKPEDAKVNLMRGSMIGKITSEGRLDKVDAASALSVREEIDIQLELGRPAMVGVDYRDTKDDDFINGGHMNVDNVTDHWVAFYARIQDPVTGAVMYLALDNYSSASENIDTRMFRTYFVGEDGRIYSEETRTYNDAMDVYGSRFHTVTNVKRAR